MEPYIDQIPNLGDLRRYLEHLSLSDPPMAQGAFVLEQVCACMRMWLHVCVCVRVRVCMHVQVLHLSNEL